MKCKLCREFIQKYPLIHKDNKLTHKLDDNVYCAQIVCAFEKKYIFDTSNWNCETMNRLRDIAEIFFTYRDDMQNGSIGIIPIPIIDVGDEIEVGYIIMAWYKDRGRTGQAYVMDDESNPMKLNKETAEAVVKYYDNKKN